MRAVIPVSPSDQPTLEPCDHRAVGLAAVRRIGEPVVATRDHHEIGGDARLRQHVVHDNALPHRNESISIAMNQQTWWVIGRHEQYRRYGGSEVARKVECVDGQLRATGGYNRNESKVTRVAATPPELSAFQTTLFDRIERGRIESRGSPVTTSV